MTFSEIPTQEGVKQRLKGLALSGKLPHALLLEGPSGNYKLALARAFVQRLHCSNPTADGDSCGRCPSCLQHASLNHIDTVYSFPVVRPEGAATPPVSDDFMPQWREFVAESPSADIEVWTSHFSKKNAKPMYYVTEARAIQRKVSMTTHNAGVRAVIMWLPERMNEETANKLLKLIEEPAEGTMLVLVSDDAKSILPTVYSRLQRIEVPRLSDDTVKAVLEVQGIDPVEAAAIAHIAEGNINAALRATMVGSGTHKRFELFVELMRLAYQRKVSELKRWATDINDAGREEAVAFYAYAQHLVRENFIYNFAHPELNYLTAEESGFSRNFARFVNEANVEQLTSVFDKAITDIRANGNGKLINFDVALKVCFLIKQGQRQ